MIDQAKVKQQKENEETSQKSLIGAAKKSTPGNFPFANLRDMLAKKK